MINTYQNDLCENNKLIIFSYFIRCLKGNKFHHKSIYSYSDSTTNGFVEHFYTKRFIYSLISDPFHSSPDHATLLRSCMLSQDVTLQIFSLFPPVTRYTTIDRNTFVVKAYKYDDAIAPPAACHVYRGERASRSERVSTAVMVT